MLQTKGKPSCVVPICNGVPKDPAKATEWYRKATDQGYEDARKELLKISKKLSEE